MSLTFIIVLVIVGLLFFILEVLVIPGTSVAGVIGFVAIAVAVWQAWVQYGYETGLTVLGASLVGSIVCLWLSLRTNTWKRVSLKESIESKVNLIDGSIVYPGARGKSVSRLAPTGKVRFGSEDFEAQSQEGFIDQGQEVEVVKIEGNKITIKPL